MSFISILLLHNLYSIKYCSNFKIVVGSDKKQHKFQTFGMILADRD